MIELDWTTFALQILNFLVLLWLLQRFLYKPVFAVIERRKADLDRVRAESERLRSEGQALRDRYEHRLAEWEQEKSEARARLADELDTERARLLAELNAELAAEREKARVLDERRQQEQRRRLEEFALAQGTRFVARLLERLSGPDLEARLVALACADLRDLPDARREAIRSACSHGETAAVASSAFPLPPAERDAVAQALQSVVGHPIAWEWKEDPSLLAGLRITMGPWVLGANLRDELKCFAEADYGEHHAVTG